MIFRFDAVLRLVLLEMELVSWEQMLCIRVYSMQALTEQQDERGLSRLNHLTENRLLGGVPLEQHPVKLSSAHKSGSAESLLTAQGTAREIAAHLQLT